MSGSTVTSIGLAALCLCLSGGGLQAQTVHGRVVDSVTGAAIPQALVILGESGAISTSTLADEEGRFELRLNRGGTVRISFSRQGYLPRTLSGITVGGRETVALGEILLAPAPIPLESVVAEAHRNRLTPGREKVRQRQLLGKGTFFPGALLAAMRPPSLSRHVADATDLWVSYDFRGTPTIFNPKAASKCVLMFLNEWPMFRVFEDEPGFTEILGYPSLDDIPLARIAAIEVYNDMRQVPPGLYFDGRGTAHACGVINVWTWDSW